MRHFLPSPLAIATLAFGMGKAAPARSAVTPIGLSLGVTACVFRISRNPMYLGLSLILLGIALLLGSAAPFVIVLGFPVLLDRRFVAREQQMLETTFGGQYRTYRQQVRKWF